MYEAVQVVAETDATCNDDLMQKVTSLHNEGSANPVLSLINNDYAVITVESSCDDGNQTFIATLATPDAVKDQIQTTWVQDVDNANLLKDKFKHTLNSAFERLSTSNKATGATVRNAKDRCVPQPCKNDATCETGSSNGVVMSKPQCTCTSTTYTGDLCEKCVDHLFISNAITDDVSVILNSTSVNFIAQCENPLLVDWGALSAIKREIVHACEVLGAENQRMIEDLEGVYHIHAETGDCDTMRPTFQQFNTAWTEKLNKLEAQMVGLQNVLKGIKAAVMDTNNSFHETHRDKAATYDISRHTVQIDKDYCHAQYVSSHKHSYIDTSQYMEMTSVERDAQLMDTVDLQWNIVRAVYIRCSRKDGKNDIVAASQHFRDDFGIVDSRRLRTIEDRRLHEMGKAEVKDSGATDSMWDTVASYFQ